MPVSDHQRQLIQPAAFSLSPEADIAAAVQKWSPAHWWTAGYDTRIFTEKEDKEKEEEEE